MKVIYQHFLNKKYIYLRIILRLMSHAIFLDRDGVINKHRTDYVKNIQEFELLPDVQDYLKELLSLGFKLIIVTNQSAVNRGLLTTEELLIIHQYLVDKLARHDCQIVDIFFCPHMPNENCECRKPKVKMFLDAAKKHNIDLGNSWVVGDSQTDIQAANKIGCRSIKVATNTSLKRAVDIISDQSRIKNTKTR
jgi:D-glycero-D-manno-heptose 1,7-bisphosphate phosphatase